MYALWTLVYNQPAPVLSGEWGALALSAWWLPVRILTVLAAVMLALTIRVIARSLDHGDKADLIRLADALMQDDAVPGGPPVLRVVGEREGPAGAPSRR